MDCFQDFIDKKLHESDNRQFIREGHNQINTCLV